MFSDHIFSDLPHLWPQLLVCCCQHCGNALLADRIRDLFRATVCYPVLMRLCSSSLRDVGCCIRNKDDGRRQTVFTREPSSNKVLKFWIFYPFFSVRKIYNISLQILAISWPHSLRSGRHIWFTPSTDDQQVHPRSFLMSLATLLLHPPPPPPPTFGGFAALPSSRASILRELSLWPPLFHRHDGKKLEG